MDSPVYSVYFGNGSWGGDACISAWVLLKKFIKRNKVTTNL